jgi:3-phenylpropionate/trans-cinnamate dioxygenase ferredoxin subunit
MSEGDFQPVLSLADVPRGKMRACEIAGRRIVVCHVREGLFALDDICTHADSRMSEGRLRGTRLICPLHGASFDVRDGRVLGAPATRPLPVHRVRLTDGQIEIALDPAAPAQTPL